MCAHACTSTRTVFFGFYHCSGHSMITVFLKSLSGIHSECKFKKLNIFRCSHYYRGVGVGCVLSVDAPVHAGLPLSVTLLSRREHQVYPQPCRSQPDRCHGCWAAGSSLQGRVDCFVASYPPGKLISNYDIDKSY